MSKTSKIDAVQPSTYGKYPRHNGGTRLSHGTNQRNAAPPKNATKQCPHCGKEPHSRENCPAKNATCSKWKRNHYAAVCRTKTPVTSKVTSTSPSSETAFLDHLAPEETEKNMVNTYRALWAGRIDTGAEVTAITQDAYQQLGKPPLTTADRKLFGPSTQPLEVLGTFEGHFNHRGRISQQMIYVVKGLQTNLLGLPAIAALQLVARIHGMQTKTDILQQFPKVFKGLGNLGEPFDIKLKPDAQPSALSTPHNIALPLRPKVANVFGQDGSYGCDIKSG